MEHTPFFGEHEHRVDIQGRISLPTQFRESFRGGIVLSRGFDRCISVHTPSQWEAYTSQVTNLPLNRAKNRRMRRLTFSSAYFLGTDRQGRVLLPLSLRQYAQIGEEVILAGMGDFLEVWSKEAWLQESEFLAEEAWRIAETSEEHP